MKAIVSHTEERERISMPEEILYIYTHVADGPKRPNVSSNLRRRLTLLETNQKGWWVGTDERTLITCIHAGRNGKTMKRNGMTLKRKKESACRMYTCKGCKQEKKYYSHFAPNYCGRCLRSGA